MSDIASVQDGGLVDPRASARRDVRAPASAREHIAYIEYFRAIAIILIVCGHSFVLAWTHYADEDPSARLSLLNMIPALVQGGTAYFVFISGFLYRQVYFDRMSHGAFLRRKALYLGLPYLIVATPLAFAEIGLGAFSAVASKEGITYGHSIYVDYVVLMSTGRMTNAFWYLPFIFLVFLVSPLFDRFIRLANPARIGILLAALALALWVHRPHDNLNPVHSLLYFANLYMLGMLFCEHRAKIMAVIARPAAIAALTILILAIAYAQAMILHSTDNIERAIGDGWAPLGLDLVLVQKYVGIFLLCAVLARWGHLAGQPLSTIARYSFGIFFVHAMVIAVLMRMPASLSPHMGEPMADLALYGAFVIAVSLGIVLLVKQATGKYSRYIIGC